MSSEVIDPTCAVVLLRLAYLGVTNALAILRLLPMSDRCATKRLVVFPAQLGGIRRNIPGSDGLPESERTLGDNSMPLKQ